MEETEKDNGHSGLSITLKLASAPLSNFDFTSIKGEAVIQAVLNDSMLYVIAQRSELLFDNIKFVQEDFSLEFTIKMTGSEKSLQCKLPIAQEAFETHDLETVEIKFGSHNKDWKADAFPVNNVNGMQFFDKQMNFRLWLSPDKFLYLHQKGLIQSQVNGDIREFMTYFVHYVGKATDQQIWRRLTGHATLQDILSLENPFNYGSLPTHEIFLLLFRVDDLLSVRTMGEDVDSFVDAMMGASLPSSKDVSLDAEKLLIKLLDPEYNNKKFPNYPASSDGLHRYNIDDIVYHFAEDITLQYSANEFYFSQNENESDIILIKNQKEIEVTNNRKGIESKTLHFTGEKGIGMEETNG